MGQLWLRLCGFLISPIVSLIILPIFLLQFLGCATTIKIPFAHLQSVEVSGKDIGGSISGGTGLKRNVYLSQDSMVGNATALVKKGKDFDGGANTALLLSLDFMERFSLFNYEGTTGIQYQFLGDSKLNAKAGNLASSVVLGYFTGSFTGDAFWLAHNYDFLTGTVKVTSYMASWLLGYRFGERIGVGVNVFGQQNTATAEGTINGGATTETLSDSSLDYGVGIQLYGNEASFYFLINPMIAQFKEPVRGEVSTYHFIGAQGGFFF